MTNAYFTTRHAMEEKVLRLNASHETTIDKTSRFWAHLENRKTWQCTAGYHHWRSFAFQLNLSQQTGNLHCVNRRSFGTRANHQLKIIFREFAQQTSGQTHSIKN